MPQTAGSHPVQGGAGGLASGSQRQKHCGCWAMQVVVRSSAVAVVDLHLPSNGEIMNTPPLIILTPPPLAPYVQRAAIRADGEGAGLRAPRHRPANKLDWFLRVSPLARRPCCWAARRFCESAVIYEYLEGRRRCCACMRTTPGSGPASGMDGVRSALLNSIGAHFYTAADEIRLQSRVPLSGGVGGARSRRRWVTGPTWRRPVQPFVDAVAPDGVPLLRRVRDASGDFGFWT